MSAIAHLLNLEPCTVLCMLSPSILSSPLPTLPTHCSDVVPPFEPRRSSRTSGCRGRLSSAVPTVSFKMPSLSFSLVLGITTLFRVDITSTTSKSLSADDTTLVMSGSIHLPSRCANSDPVDWMSSRVPCRFCSVFSVFFCLSHTLLLFVLWDSGFVATLH